MTTKKAEDYILKFIKANNITDKLKFIVFESVYDAFPNHPRDRINRFKGAYYPSKQVIMIIANEHDNHIDLKKTLNHEVFGHYGINHLMPKQKEKLLNIIANIDSKSTVGKLRDNLLNNIYKELQDNPLLIAEETFAHMAEDLNSQIKAYQGIPDINNIKTSKQIIDVMKSIQAGIVSQKLRLKIIPKQDNLQFSLLEPNEENTINKDTYELLVKLSRESFFKEHKATLIGGTALAYHFNHRESFDIDICFPEHNKLPDIPFLDKLNFQLMKHDEYLRNKFINEGGDIYDYVRVYMHQDTGIKVDFVVNTGTNIYESDILKYDLKAKRFNNITITSPETIFKLKSLLILDRNKIRDMYDLACFFKNGYSAKSFLDTIKQFRITYTNKDIKRWLDAKKPNLEDIKTEPISKPKYTNLTDYYVIKDYIVNKVDIEINKERNKDNKKAKHLKKDRGIEP